MGPNGVCSRAAAAVDPARADQQRRRSALLHYEGEERRGRAGATLATGTMDGTAGVRYGGGWGRGADGGVVWHLILGI